MLPLLMTHSVNAKRLLHFFRSLIVGFLAHKFTELRV